MSHTFFVYLYLSNCRKTTWPGPLVRTGNINRKTATFLLCLLKADNRFRIASSSLDVPTVLFIGFFWQPGNIPTSKRISFKLKRICIWLKKSEDNFYKERAYLQYANACYVMLINMPIRVTFNEESYLYIVNTKLGFYIGIWS